MKDICCIGHITLDKIITPQNTVFMPGGTSFYFSHGINHLPKKISYQLVTSLAQSEMKSVDKMREQGIDIKVFPSEHTVFFENSYGSNSNNRSQRVLAKADPFKTEYFKDVDAKVYHLGSLLADDFSLETIKYLSTKGKISIDVQGYLREVRNQHVYAIPWKEKMEALKYTDILKVNESEMEVLSGTKDPKESALRFASWGVKEVVITEGSYGSIIYAEGQFHIIPAYKPNQIVDATGCGDTYSAGYLYCRSQGADYDEAGRFAAAMCTCKLQHSGPFEGSEGDIKRIIKTSNSFLLNTLSQKISVE